eukprot:Em0015g1252a
MQEANEAEGVPSLIADLSIRRVWQPQTVALFDVRVTDTDARAVPLTAKRVVSAILSSAEEAKKKKYSEAAALRRASFTPFVVSVDGVLGREANFLIKHLAQKLAHKWEKSNSEVLGWMRARLSFAILRATNLCLRGSRNKWRSAFGMDDGAVLPCISA